MNNNIAKLQNEVEKVVSDAQDVQRTSEQLSDEQLSVYIFDGDVSLFLPSEREAILALVSSITPRVTFRQHPTYDFLTSCTEAEFAVLCNYQDLLKALGKKDMVEVEKYRQLLAKGN